ncbi:MAG TPA: hypothetical protein VFF06_23885 [Polyangia bacterium]|nr:hypothetical protein [Polyangia bacterium]
MGVAALVLGIIGTLFSLIPFTFWIGVVLGLIALILGIFGRKSAVAAGGPTGTATAGLVLGIVALVLGVLMWVLCGLMISGAKKGFEEAVKNPDNWKPKSQPLSGEVIKVTPKQLLADYSANEVSADMKYKGKTLEISGAIESISKDLFDNIFVSVEAGDPIRTIQCYFDAENTKKVAALTKGQKITVQGRGDGLMMNVVLRDSVLK